MLVVQFTFQHSPLYHDDDSSYNYQGLVSSTASSPLHCFHPSDFTLKQLQTLSFISWNQESMPGKDVKGAGPRLAKCKPG